MSTHSNIYLRLKEETKGTTIKFDPTKLPQPEGDREFPIKDVNVPKDAKFMRIYHHWDGYVTGVGKTLIEHYKDYDTILNLLAMGDMSSINGTITSYQGWRNENTPPQFLGDKEKVRRWSKTKKELVTRTEKTTDKDGNLDSKKAICEEYAYLFDGEKWWVSYYEWNDKTQKSRCTGWLNLESELKREKAEIEERMKARTNA